MGPILFYDGECGMCARSVRWALKHDRLGELKFSPLQGDTYLSRVSNERPESLESLVLADASGVFTHSTAVLRMLFHLGGVWRTMSSLGKIIPRPIRDAMYRFVAKRRMLWFGTADQCQIPSPSQKLRFLP